MGKAALSMESYLTVEGMGDRGGRSAHEDEDGGDGNAASALLMALTKLQLMLDDTERGLNTRARYVDYTDRSRDGDSSLDIGPGISVDLGNASATTLGCLERAVSERKRVEIEYYSYARDELTARAVDPAAVFNREGRWYLTGWCHSASAERVFRVDRIRSLEVTDIAVTVGHPSGGLSAFNPGDCGCVVTLRLDRQGWWMAECCPVSERREIGGDRLEIDVAVSGLPWLERLLLQLGDHAEVVTDDPELAGLRSSAASRILTRYQRPSVSIGAAGSPGE